MAGCLTSAACKVLAETLRSLERDDLASRRAAAGAPERTVEYKLSEPGLSPSTTHRGGAAHIPANWTGTATTTTRPARQPIPPPLPRPRISSRLLIRAGIAEERPGRLPARADQMRSDLPNTDFAESQVRLSVTSKCDRKSALVRFW